MKEKLRFLISRLLEEMPEYGNTPIPEKEEELFNLFRALCNVRMPKGKLSDVFYEKEAEVLKEMTGRKTIADVTCLKPSSLNPKLYLWQGDITRLNADAIVNAANSQMLGCFAPLHSCIDNMIHTMAGVELREECQRIMQGRELATGMPSSHRPLIFHQAMSFIRSVLSFR